jgi:hypothetical protein
MDSKVIKAIAMILGFEAKRSERSLVALLKSRILFHGCKLTNSPEGYWYADPTLSHQDHLNHSIQTGSRTAQSVMLPRNMLA